MRLFAVSSLVLALLAAGAGAGLSLRASEAPSPGNASSASPDPPRGARRGKPRAEARREPPPIQWRDSRALGVPSGGSLERGVQLPASGDLFGTWDPILRRSPNRAWRRWATDDMVRLVLRVARRFRARHPEALPMLVGDLSRRHGGDFGQRYGIVGHSTHQNGLDVDVYYPRRDRRPRVPDTPQQVDRRLSQTLVDLFVAAGAKRVLTGPNLPLTGPPAVVVPYPNHDNHLHVRIANPGPGS